MLKPSWWSRCARIVAADLSLSHTDRKTLPSSGSDAPAAATALPKAAGKFSAMPITSPVDFISGPSCVSEPGKRSNGSTASLTLTYSGTRRTGPRSASCSPRMTRVASCAMGTPVALLTNGAARVHLEHVQLVVLVGELHVDETPHAETEGKLLRLLAHLLERALPERDRRDDAGGVAGVHARLFDVLHDGADVDVVAVADRVHVDLDSVLEELVDQHEALGADGGGGRHVVLELGGAVDDLHGAAAEDVGRPHQQRVADPVGDRRRLRGRRRQPVLGTLDAELLEELPEAPAIFGQVDRLLRRAEDGDAGLGQRPGDLERRLTAELDDHSLGLLVGDDVGHVFEGERLEIQAVGDVVVGGDRLGVAVDHDRLVAHLAGGQRGVHAAVVELDALADAVGPRTEDDHAFALAGLGLVLLFVGRVEVRGLGLELGGARIDRLVHRQHVVLDAQGPDLALAAAGELAEPLVAEAVALHAPQQLRRELRRRPHLALELHDVAELGEEERRDAGELVDVVYVEAQAKALQDELVALGRGDGERLAQLLGARGKLGRAVELARAHRLQA